jgi:hypothetical protein
MEQAQRYAKNAKHCYVEEISQFWHPKRVSPRRLQKAILNGLKYFSGVKPRILQWRFEGRWMLGMWGR